MIFVCKKKQKVLRYIFFNAKVVSVFLFDDFSGAKKNRNFHDIFLFSKIILL